MIRGHICALGSFVITWTGAFSQRPVDTAAYGRHTVFASALGNSAFYSLNYDRRWRTGRSMMSWSVGGSYLPDVGESGGPVAPKYSIPIQWNWFPGRKHHIELGAGVTLASGWYAQSGDPTIISRAAYVTLKPVGYRFQAEPGRFFLRAYPLVFIKAIEFDPAWVELTNETGENKHPIFPWVGIDLGYTFRPKRSEGLDRRSGPAR
jgi:hypothetical protein